MDDYLENIKKKIEDKTIKKREKVKVIQDYVEVAADKELIEIIDLIAKLNI